MKLSLTTEIVFKMSAWTIPKPNTKPLEWDEDDLDRDPPSANYLVYDSHSAAPPGFAVRVGKKASVFLVVKMVKGQKMKIQVWSQREPAGTGSTLQRKTAHHRELPLDFTRVNRHLLGSKLNLRIIHEESQIPSGIQS